MSASSTPKGTPVQRSPSDGILEDIQSPQHSTPGSGAQQKKRISSLLQSPVRGVFTLMMLLPVCSPAAQTTLHFRGRGRLVPYVCIHLALSSWGPAAALIHLYHRNMSAFVRSPFERSWMCWSRSRWRREGAHPTCGHWDSWLISWPRTALLQHCRSRHPVRAN